jgi:hypothetical protein
LLVAVLSFNFFEFWFFPLPFLNFPFLWYWACNVWSTASSFNLSQVWIHVRWDLCQENFVLNFM